MAEIWSKAVDGLFKGGKWGMYGGAAVGVLAGFTMVAPQVAFDLFFLGPFGAAATLGVLGALGGIAAGAAIGAIGGAIYGAVKTAFAPSPEKAPPEQDRQHYEDMSRDAHEQTLSLARESSTAFQENLKHSRQRGNSNNYKGL